MLIVSNFLLWIVVLLQLVAIGALARKVTAVPPGRPARMGQAPAWRRARQDGAVPTAPALPVRDGRATMLFYMTPDCQTGRRLAADADLMARSEGLILLLARDGQGPGPFASGVRGDRAARTRASSPYVMIITAAGDVAAQGQVRSRGDMARLLALASGDAMTVAEPA